MKSQLFALFVAFFSSITGLCQENKFVRTDYVLPFGTISSGTTYDIFADKWTSESYHVSEAFSIQPSAILLLDSVLRKYNIARYNLPVAFSYNKFEKDKLVIKMASVSMPTSMRDSLDNEIKKIMSICKVKHLYGNRNSFAFTIFYQNTKEKPLQIPDTRKYVVDSSIGTEPIISKEVDTVYSYCQKNGIDCPDTFDVTVVFGMIGSAQELEGRYIEDYKTHRYLYVDFFSILLDHLKVIANERGIDKGFINIHKNASGSSAPIKMHYVENNYIKCFGPIGDNTLSPYGPYRDFFVNLHGSISGCEIQDLYSIEPSVIEILDSELKYYDVPFLKINLSFDTNIGKMIIDSISNNGNLLIEEIGMKKKLQSKISCCKVEHLYGENNLMEFPLLWRNHQMSPDLSPYKYNGKELDRMHGLDTYDYGARQYDPVLCQWDRMDPLCEKYYGISPYAYCANNPVNRIDPNGCDSLYWGQDGVLIGCFGNDKNQTYNYVIKTTFATDEVYANNNNQRGWCNPISNEKYDETVKEIQAGNYSSPNIVFVGTTKRGKNMLNVIEDDGKGGSTPQNNREYFGTFNGDEVENIGKSNIGIIGSVRPVSKRRGKIDFHSHPSGRQEILVNGQMKGAHWIQPPSAQDISTAKVTEYVIGVGYGLIYRYDKDGINAIFPSMIFK